VNHHTPARTSIRRRLLLAAAAGTSLVAFVAPSAQAAWVCAAVGDPLDLGACVDDPLPKHLPSTPRL